MLLSPIVLDYIMDSEVPKPCRHFIGRDKELEELYTMLEENRHVFFAESPESEKVNLPKPTQSSTENNTPIYFIWNTPVIYIKIL